MKPRLLDLFCGAGGCARGYQMAGFHVTGIDIKPQPRYAGDVFVCADALEYVAEHGHEFDAIHASPPCQAYSSMRHVTGKEYPMLIEITRHMLNKTGKPYVIENVEGAPLFNAVILCGTMFGLKTFRHRLFESNVFMLMPPHITHTLYGKAAKQGRPTTADRQYLTVTGNFSGIACGQRAMGIDWMNKQELTQAIPPAYTQWIGERLLETMAVSTC